ncbi:cation:proton antiporter [Pseudosporangium ferrugineum]|uniref:Sodium/proton antiporter (CPA1 family) n=1 Tax=Pseudosporangium ferrugineum TaxID=439699 RepID=A0A2T0SBN8_9ACTN|nr:cation:proton antiporter [Pseudosporangium ferrugineum]PRY30845.1 sodium/proton antiporter (CPA1 family) [Pseudosporangium ferrugineum]
MTSAALALTAALVFAWGAFSARLERADLTAPVVFVGLGTLLAGSVHADVDAAGITVLTEATLAWVLFSDAARVGVRELRGDAGVYGRLLGLALPLTVVLGSVLAWALLGVVLPWYALLIGAALAPTDAALGAVVITHPAVPARIRRILNVESGLNDGIVTPVVMVALAGAASTGGEADAGVLTAALQLAGGALIGAAVGSLGGRLLRAAGRRGWTGDSFAGPAVLALALVAYAASVAGHGNGFVAAFAGGIAFGHVAGPRGPREVFYIDETAGLASLLVWLLFGVYAVPALLGGIDATMLVYAVLSLTVVRMVPVALSLIGSGLGGRTVLFAGWFGPRGLASVVFALLALEQLHERAAPAVAAIVLTVLLSVVAHGVSAGPLAARYGAASRSAGPASVHEPAATARLRRSLPGRDSGAAVTSGGTP